MKAVIILGNINKINKNVLNNAYIIGVEKGAYKALLENIKLDCAIGDFDSITSREYDFIANNTSNIIKLKSEKDLTDTKEAINLCKDFDEIIILGGITGKRIEHLFANIIELINNSKIQLMDDNSLIVTKKTSFIPVLDYKFVSFFSLDNDTIISLKGFKYPLNAYNLKMNDALCISNEIVNKNEAFVEIRKGRILIVYSQGEVNEVI